jgi:hypothetical protein
MSRDYVELLDYIFRILVQTALVQLMLLVGQGSLLMVSPAMLLFTSLKTATRIIAVTTAAAAAATTLTQHIRLRHQVRPIADVSLIIMHKTYSCCRSAYTAESLLVDQAAVTASLPRTAKPQATSHILYSLDYIDAVDQLASTTPNTFFIMPCR